MSCSQWYSFLSLHTQQGKTGEPGEHLQTVKCFISDEISVHVNSTPKYLKQLAYVTSTSLPQSACQA